VIADMLVAYKVFREQFRSRVSLDRDQHRIDVDYVDGPFRHLSTNWQFTDQDGGGCLVDFAVSFEFRNRLLQSTAQRVFDKAFRKMVDAFVERAKAVYGGREMPQATTQNTTPEKPTDTDVVLATKPA
ncbi:MAG: type II toxin-antitoxin system RatA family toxin, partial [Pseudomonadota bacterium]